MQYSNTTTKDGLLQRCELFTGMTDGNITGDIELKNVFTSLINQTYQQIVLMILSAQDEWDWDDTNNSGDPLLTKNLVQDQQGYELAVSDKVLKVKRVEVSYDGSSWYRAMPFDVNERSKTVDSSNIGEFSKTEPFYDVWSNQIMLYPIPDAAVTSGLKVWISREPDEFTTSDTTQEPGIDKAFHEMIAVGASLKWVIAKNPRKRKSLAELYENYEERLKRHYGFKTEDRDKIVMRSQYTHNYGE